MLDLKSLCPYTGFMEETMLAAYNRFLSINRLRDTKQRRLIFETFMEQDKHLTAEGLYHTLQKDSPHIGQATVYRTLRLLCESGLAHEINMRSQDLQGLNGQSSYFEPVLFRRHHDHLVCTGCGIYLEFSDEELENLQEQIATRHNFQMNSHSHILYGLCQDCQDSA